MHFKYVKNNSEWWAMYDFNWFALKMIRLFIVYI